MAETNTFTTCATGKKKCLIGVISAVAVLLVSILAGCFTIVSPGHVGVKVKFGKVNIDQPLDPGLKTKAPWTESVIQVNRQIKSVSDDNSVLTQDLQTITSEGRLSYALNAKYIPKMYELIGVRQDLEDTVIKPAIKESFKGATSNFSAANLIKQRSTVKAKILELIENFIESSLSEKGLLGLIEISNFAITDFEFSAKFKESIESKVKAEQDAEKAKQEKERKITQAQAEAESNKLKADADAYLIEKKAEANNSKTKYEADAEAYLIEKKAEAKTDAINKEGEAIGKHPQLLKLRTTERWDGAMPKVTGGVIPVMQMPTHDEN